DEAAGVVAVVVVLTHCSWDRCLAIWVAAPAVGDRAAAGEVEASAAVVLVEAVTSEVEVRVVVGIEFPRKGAKTQWKTFGTILLCAFATLRGKTLLVFSSSPNNYG